MDNFLFSFSIVPYEVILTYSLVIGVEFFWHFRYVHLKGGEGGVNSSFFSPLPFLH